MNMLEKLKSDYNLLIAAKHSKSACVKYSLQFNNVTINLYFDMFDTQLSSLNLILIYLHNYYYTSLNASNISIPSQYLKQIPIEILSQILDADKTLKSFFAKINEEVLNKQPIRASYSKDYQFINAVTSDKSTDNLPFLHHLRHGRMQNETLELLHATMSIPYMALKAIQNHNMTLVRTDKLEYRKQLTLILQEHSISLEDF
ncbi:MAG: hypothetical protein J6X78_04090 [Treponema sp.]|nr:hypothetical protein [Treponema sp.]